MTQNEIREMTPEELFLMTLFNDKPRSERALNLDQIKKKLQEVLSNLKWIQREVLRMRYGLIGERIHTFKEVSDLLGRSPSDIVRIEQEAIKRLQILNKRIELEEAIIAAFSGP